MKSGRISAVCFVTPLAYGCLVLISVVFFEFAVANLIFQAPCGPDKAYQENLLGSAEKTDTKGACSILCLKDDTCNSFTYNLGNNLCQLSTGVENDCNQLKTETDSLYYVAVSQTIIYNMSSVIKLTT